MFLKVKAEGGVGSVAGEPKIIQRSGITGESSSNVKGGEPIMAAIKDVCFYVFTHNSIHCRTIPNTFLAEGSSSRAAGIEFLIYSKD